MIIKAQFIVASLIIGLTTAASFSGSALGKRDSLLLTNSSIIKPYKPEITPQAFCENNIVATTLKRNCAQKYFEPGTAPSSMQLNKARNEIASLSKSYGELADTLEVNATDDAMILVNVARQRAEFLKKISIQPSLTDNNYYLYFNGLLVGLGLSYNPFSNTFKSLPNDLARYLLDPSKVGYEINLLSVTNKIGFFFFGAIAFALFITLIRQRINNFGLIIIFFIFLLLLLGLVVTRDASINFGSYSSYFSLNPLRNIFPRQLIISGLCFCIFTASLFLIAAPKIDIQRRLSNNYYNLIVIVAPISTILVYTIAGVPIGAEFLKFTACLSCALVLTRYGRIIELTQNHIGILKALIYKNKGSELNIVNRDKNFLSASSTFQIFFAKKIIAMPIGLALAFCGSALFFSDLGGTLVAGMVVFFSVFILLGTKFALLASLPIGFATSLLFIFSEKVKGRIELMQDPMSASISDFARLEEFVFAAKSTGYGLNKIKWCSNDGVCIPLQSLSDYMPSLLMAALGEKISLSILFLFCLLILILCVKCFLLSWNYESKNRLLIMTASFLCLACFFQVIVTVLGNWRVIPLTGLGLPLISIGVSSSISASFGLGLATGIVFKK
jgi:cell division protein FtsW (lipid II flippase)